MSTRFDHISESALLLKYQTDGKKEWMGAILERYTTLLLGVAIKYLKDEELAKDIVQQIFLKILSLPYQNQYDNFGGWIYTITKNACLTSLRSNMLYVNDEHIQYLAAESPKLLDEHLEEAATINNIRVALADLKDEQKICLTLFYFSNQSYQSIARLLNMDVQKVKSHIQNGKRNLKIKLESKL